MFIKKYMNKYQFAVQLITLFQINWQLQTLFRALRDGLLNNQDLIGLSSSSPSLGSPLPIQSSHFWTLALRIRRQEPQVRPHTHYIDSKERKMHQLIQMQATNEIKCSRHTIANNLR